jgi:hypothetical protein
MTMRQRRVVLSLVAAGLVVLALSPAADAQAARTWVSGVGDDQNPCTRVAPCKTFAGAISKTATRGEISVIDAGSYGKLVTTKSITINGEGALAGILVDEGSGVIINAVSTAKVIIRNISINGAGTGLNGIRYLAGGQLTLEKVTITGFPAGFCVDASLSVGAELIIQDSSFTDCRAGVRLSAETGQLLTTLDNVRITNMTTHGVQTSAGAGQTFVTIKHSTISHNNQNGVRAASSTSIINLEDNMIAFNNGVAVNAAAIGARIRISNNTIVNNNVGIAIAIGGRVQSAGNNRVEGNGSTEDPNDIPTPYTIK